MFPISGKNVRCEIGQNVSPTLKKDICHSAGGSMRRDSYGQLGRPEADEQQRAGKIQDAASSVLRLAVMDATRANKNWKCHDLPCTDHCQALLLTPYSITPQPYTVEAGQCCIALVHCAGQGSAWCGCAVQWVSVGCSGSPPVPIMGGHAYC